MIIMTLRETHRIGGYHHIGDNNTTQGDSSVRFYSICSSGSGLGADPGTGECPRGENWPLTEYRNVVQLVTGGEMYIPVEVKIECPYCKAIFGIGTKDGVHDTPELVSCPYTANRGGCGRSFAVKVTLEPVVEVFKLWPVEDTD